MVSAAAATALSAHKIAAVARVTPENAETAFQWLADRGDEALFACSATKISSGTERLVIVSRYRLLLVRWKWGRPAFRELKLLDLRGITAEGDAGAWGFAGDVTAQLRSPRLAEAARATLQAHGLITLCLDVPPLALSLPAKWGPLGFEAEGREIDMGFSRTWLACCSYGAGPPLTREGAARRRRLAGFLAQLVSRPAADDRVLDLTYCAELTASDFAGAAVALRFTSMFSGLRLKDVPLGDALSALCACARSSASLTTLCLSGVLQEAKLLGMRSPAKALGEALAEGARRAAGADGALPLTSLDLSDNELRDAGVVAIGQLVGSLKSGLVLLDISSCHGSGRALASLSSAIHSNAHVAVSRVRTRRTTHPSPGPNPEPNPEPAPNPSPNPKPNPNPDPDLNPPCPGRVADAPPRRKRDRAPRHASPLRRIAMPRRARRARPALDGMWRAAGASRTYPVRREAAFACPTR